MSTPQQNKTPRAVIEHMVREQIYGKMGLPLPSLAKAPNGFVVNISARHCHLTKKAVEALFGSNYRLTPDKWLCQQGAYAAREAVTLIGPRSRVISNLRILGPCRGLSQVELAYTDAISLGFDIPVRMSGDVAGTPGCMLMGPNGYYKMNEGVIRAQPHVHMHPDDATHYGVNHLDTMKMKIHSECSITFNNIIVRMDESFNLEAHIDTDEGNACRLKPDTFCELLK